MPGCRSGKMCGSSLKVREQMAKNDMVFVQHVQTREMESGLSGILGSDFQVRKLVKII